MLHDEVGAVGHGDRLAEARLDLLLDPEVLEDRLLAFVELDDLDLVGSDAADVAADLLVEHLVVDVDVREVRVEQVAQDGRGAVEFADQLRRRLGGARVGDRRFPAGDQVLDVLVEFGYLLAVGYRTHDQSEALRLDAHGQALQALTLSELLIFWEMETTSENGTSTT